MEVIQGRSDTLMRQQGNIVMAASPSSPFSCALSHADLMVTNTRSLVAMALGSTRGLWSTTSR